GVPRALVRDECGGACGGEEVRRLDLGRARHRRDETEAAARREGPGRARSHAHLEAHARPEGDFESRQGAVSLRPLSPHAAHAGRGSVSTVPVNQNSDACPSSLLAFARALGFAGAGSSAPGATGSISAAESFAARLTATETSCAANVSSGAGT